jgi:hypothetical protein
MIEGQNKQNTGVQELQEFRRRKMLREDEDLSPICRACSEELPNREGDGPAIHSATPELLQLLNSCIYHVRI